MQQTLPPSLQSVHQDWRASRIAGAASVASSGVGAANATATRAAKTKVVNCMFVIKKRVFLSFDKYEMEVRRSSQLTGLWQSCK